MNRLTYVVAICVALLHHVPSFATFMVFSGNTQGPDTENILMPDDSVGMAIHGTTNQSGRVVAFASPTHFLASPSAGLARIEARESNDISSDQVAIDDTISISLANDALSFGGLSFNIFRGGGLGDGGTLTITVSGFESNGDPVSTTFTEDSDSNPLSIGNGANFFTVVASDGQRITAVDIMPDVDSSYADLRQVRISNIIPEPSSWLLVVAGAVLVLTQRRQLRDSFRMRLG